MADGSQDQSAPADETMSNERGVSNERAPEGDRSFAAVRDRFRMPLEDAMMTQRAVRKLLPDPVDDDIILHCIELAQRAPTGSNGQNWEFVVVKDRGNKEALGRQYKRAFTLYGGIGERFVDIDEANRRALQAVEWQIDNFVDIPVVVVACLRGARLPFVPQPPTVESTYYGSIYPSVQNLLLAARSVGLGAALVTLPLWSTTIARRILGLPLSVLPACVVPMGWPRGRYGPTSRKPVGDVVHLDRYGDQPWKQT